MSPVRVSLVVVTWNSADVVVALLDALVAQRPLCSCEVVIVDNGSRDDTVELVRRHQVPVMVIVNPRNVGLAAANNQGMSAASGDLVLICNPDIVPLPGAVDALVEAADRHPRAAFVVAALQHPDGTQQTGVGDLPSFREAFLGRRAARLRGAVGGFWWDGWPHDEERKIGHGQEACYLVRRVALEEVGGQDPAYKLDWEGVDWAARMHDAGWEIWFCPDSNVVHVGGASLRKARVRWVVWSHRGMYRYFATRGPWWRRPLLGIAIGARGSLKLVMLLRPDLYDRGLRAVPS